MDISLFSFCFVKLKLNAFGDLIVRFAALVNYFGFFLVTPNLEFRALQKKFNKNTSLIVTVDLFLFFLFSI